MNIKTKFKNLFNKKLRENEQIRKALQAARYEEINRLKKIHGANVDKVVKELNTESQIKVENLKIEMDEILEENKKLNKRNKYLEDLYFDTIYIAKENSIVTQEMSTDATRLEEMVVRMTGLIHGINEKAQNHYEKTEREKIKIKEKLKKMEETK